MNSKNDIEFLELRIAELEKDIEIRKKTETILRNNEETVYQFFENCSNVLILKEIHNNSILYVGSAYKDVFGQPIETLLNNPYAFLDLILPEDRPFVEHGIRHQSCLKTSCDSFETEFRILHTNGRIRWIRFRSIPIIDNFGVMYRVAIVAEDITEKKQKEEEIRSSNKNLSFRSDYFNHILDSIRDGFFSLDHQLTIQFINRAAKKIFGIDHQDVCGQNIVSIISEGSRSVFEEKFLMALQNKDQIQFEIRMNGLWQEDWYLVNVYPFEEGISVFFQKITEKKQALETLQRSENRFQEILNRAPAVIYVKNTSGRYTFINRQFEELSGYQREQVLGRTDFDLFPEEVAKNSTYNDNQVIQRGLPIGKEEFGPVNGEMHAFISMKYPLFDDEGRVCEICGISTDINERKVMEESLKQSERRLNEAQRMAHIGSFDRNLKTGDVWVSDELYRIWGYEPGGPIPVFENHVHKDDRQKFIDAKNLVMNLKTPNELEYRIIRKDGSERILITNAYVDVSDTGELIRFYGTTQDVTERKIVEYELNKTRKYLFQILDSSPSAYIGVKSDGVITLFNFAAENLFGVLSADALEKEFDKAIPDYAQYKKDICEVIKTKQAVIKEKISVVLGGRHYFHSVHIYPLTAENMDGVVMRIDDVTEKVRLEEIMIQTEKMMSVGGLAAGMAHEINNPLSGIIQSAQNVLRRISPDLDLNIKTALECGADFNSIQSYMKKRGIITFIEGIRTSGKKASDIVSNMLSFSRRSESHMVPVNLSELIDKTIELASHDYDLKKNYDFRLIQILRDYDPDLPLIPCTITEIEQVILNLLRNAAQAMIPHQHQPKITIRLKKENNMARIEVEDNGPGMDDDIRKRIFEPFFTTKSVGVGTGLGLSVSYFIITTNHKGSICVKSAPGKGSCFIIHLPMQRPSSMTISKANHG